MQCAIFRTVVGLLLLTLVDGAPVTVANIDPAVGVKNKCPNHKLDRFELEENLCGDSPGNSCPVIVKEDVTGIDGGAVDCDAIVHIQGEEGGNLDTANFIYGKVAGSDDTLVGTAAFAVTAAVLRALCPFPCRDTSGSSPIYTCPSSPAECDTNSSDHLSVPLPILSHGHMVLTPLVSEAQVDLQYDFGVSPGPELPDPSGDPDESNKISPPMYADTWLISQTSEKSCGSEQGNLYSPEEVYLPSACGGPASSQQPPCPLTGSIADYGLSCFSEGSDNCLDVTFWLDGATDAGGVYCENGECPRIGLVTRKFRLVNQVAQGTTRIPVGVLRDVCPFTCTDGIDESQWNLSGLCAESSESCVHVAPDESRGGTAWDYDIPGSTHAQLVVVGYAPVACGLTTTTTTTTTTEASKTSSAAAFPGGAGVSLAASVAVVAGVATFWP